LFLTKSDAKPNASLALQFAEIEIPEYTMQSLHSIAVDALPPQAVVLGSACHDRHDEGVAVNQRTRFAVLQGQ
jgi:hypothetical protein